jgi:hypothetical protein
VLEAFAEYDDVDQNIREPAASPTGRGKPNIDRVAVHSAGLRFQFSFVAVLCFCQQDDIPYCSCQQSLEEGVTSGESCENRAVRNVQETLLHFACVDANHNCVCAV